MQNLGPGYMNVHWTILSTFLYIWKFSKYSFEKKIHTSRNHWSTVPGLSCYSLINDFPPERKCLFSSLWIPPLHSFSHSCPFHIQPYFLVSQGKEAALFFWKQIRLRGTLHFTAVMLVIFTSKDCYLDPVCSVSQFIS